MKPGLALLIVLLIALGLREAPASLHRVAPEEARPELGAWWLDDPGTTYRLRHVELGLAADRLPAFDRFLDHPEGREVPASPILTGGLAILADLFLSEPGGDRALGGVDEGRLEACAVHVGPFLGTAVVLAVFLAAWRRRRSASPVPPLLAAALCAAAPAAVQASAAARVDDGTWLALIAAVQLAVAPRAFAVGEATDRIGGALVLGLVTGLAVASAPLGLILFAATWCVFFALTVGVDQVRAQTAQREGSMFVIVAGAVSLLPTFEGPWELVGGGLVESAAHGTTGLVFVSGLPFLAGALIPGRWNDAVRAWLLLAVVVAAVVFVPVIREGLLAGFEVTRSGVELVARPDERGPLFVGPDGVDVARVLGPLTPLIVLFPLAWALVATGRRSPVRQQLLILGAATFGLVVWERSLAPMFVVAMSCTWSAALDDDLLRPDGRRRARVFAVTSFAVLIAHAVAPFVTLELPSTRAERLAFVSGLRWMRTHTPSAGAWNAPGATHDWGVLSVPSAGLDIAYHARRPVVASGVGERFGAEQAAAVTRALLETDSDAFARRLRGLDAAYVVVGPRMLRDTRHVERRFEELRDETDVAGPAGLRRSALWRLTMTEPELGEHGFAHLERVYAAPLRVTPEGRLPSGREPAGPAISIWALVGEAEEPTRAELQAPVR